MQLLILWCMVLSLSSQELRNNHKHRKHHHKREKELEFVQVSADLSDQRIILEGIIEQVNQLALLVQRQNYFDDSMKNRPKELIKQLDALDSKRSNEEIKIIESLKQQLHIISQEMSKGDSTVQCAGEEVCQICNAQVYYVLDEDNWYMIGFEHGFKKEFQYLLDSAKQALGHADILLTFSSENHVCLQFLNMKQQIEINAVLNHYLGTTLTDYQNDLVHLPTHAIPQEFFVRASYLNRQFAYHDLKFSVIDTQPHEILGGRLSKLQFSIDNQNVNIQFEGQLFLQQSIYPFQYYTTKGSDQIEQVNFDVKFLFQINVKYSQQLAENYVSSNQLKDYYKFSQLKASTLINDQEIVFSVDFD